MNGVKDDKMENQEIKSSARGIKFDLSEIYSDIEDPAIKKDFNLILQLALNFEKKYKGKINVPDGPPIEILLMAIKKFEDIQRRLSKIHLFAFLNHIADVLDETASNFKERFEQRLTEISNLILFFELEWMNLDEKAARKLIGHPELKEYRHYLSKLRALKPHKLSEPEEKLIAELNPSGAGALQELFDKIIASLEFPVEIGGVSKKMTLNEALSRLQSPEEKTRQAAFDSIYEILPKQRPAIPFVYSKLWQHKLTIDAKRKFPSSMTEMNLYNEVGAASVETMMRITEENYPLAHEYWQIKARLMKKEKLPIYDQYAPVGSSPDKVSFDQAKNLILSSFGNFHPQFREIAQMFFDRNWIDAEPRKRKRHGACCTDESPDPHPYVLMSYNDTQTDCITLAHELGHGIHGYLARKQNFLNYKSGVALAEIASVFAEKIIFENEISREKNKNVLIGLYADEIERFFMTVFRQNVLTKFEKRIFEERAKKQLAAEEIGQIWLEEQRSYYGPAVDIPEKYSWGWSYIPHFIHAPFYCYGYTFGELVTLSLFKTHKEKGAGFAPEYLTLLEAGGSDSPANLLKPFGDLNGADFWERGFSVLKEDFDKFKSLID